MVSNQFATDTIVQRKYSPSTNSIRHNWSHLPSWTFSFHYSPDFSSILFSVSDFTLLNPPNYFDHKYYSVLGLIFPCLFFVYNLFLADIIKFIALYTLYVLMTSTFIFLVLTIFLTYISICIPIPIPIRIFISLLCLSTLKISNHWSNRHITVQNNY